MIEPKADLKGMEFGKWIVLEQAEDYIAPKNGKHYERWRCMCRCENKTVSDIRKSALISGKSSQCVICAREISVKKASAKRITHGDYKSRLYRIWHLMKRRCYEQTNEHYQWYGARGITVCDEWRESYENFRQWAMSNGYEKTLTIERIDVDGNYCPENCKWATVKEQGNNRRNNICIMWNNETHTLKEWSEILDINYMTLRNRVCYHHWSIERAFTTPAKRQNDMKEEN
jgi:hypothetical protein